MDASPLFPRHEVPGYGRSRFDADAGLADALELACDRMLHTLPQRLGAETVAASFGLQSPRLHQGLLISSDRFVVTKAESRALKGELPDTLAVVMEGAVLAQICYDFAVPLAVWCAPSGGQRCSMYCRLYCQACSR